ncbi:MAG: DUF2510 domain-containing protein [Acidimicrobiales bacterium]
MAGQIAGPSTITLELIGAVVVLSMLLGAIDILRHPGWAWKAAEESKPAYLVLDLLLPIVGLTLYAFKARPKVAAISGEGRAASLPFERFAEELSQMQREQWSADRVDETSTFGSFGVALTARDLANLTTEEQVTVTTPERVLATVGAPVEAQRPASEMPRVTAGMTRLQTAPASAPVRDSIDAPAPPPPPPAAPAPASAPPAPSPSPSPAAPAPASAPPAPSPSPPPAAPAGGSGPRPAPTTPFGPAQSSTDAPPPSGLIGTRPAVPPAAHEISTHSDWARSLSRSEAPEEERPVEISSTFFSNEGKPTGVSRFIRPQIGLSRVRRPKEKTKRTAIPVDRPPTTGAPHAQGASGGLARPEPQTQPQVQPQAHTDPAPPVTIDQPEWPRGALRVEASRRAPMAPAGWNPDPTGRHQFRYWDGLHWTQNVADSGRQSKDAIAS